MSTCCTETSPHFVTETGAYISRINPKRCGQNCYKVRFQAAKGKSRKRKLKIFWWHFLSHGFILDWSTTELNWFTSGPSSLTLSLGTSFLVIGYYSVRDSSIVLINLEYSLVEYINNLRRIKYLVNRRKAYFLLIYIKKLQDIDAIWLFRI